MRKPPLQTLKKLIQERYSTAKSIFWAGSLASNKGNSASDLDLVVIYAKVPQAYREAFIYEKWPVDVFVHDLDTLRYFFEESRSGSGISGLSRMVLEGLEITEPTNFSQQAKTLAQDCLTAGPAIWDKAQIDKERFLITDALEDIQFPATREEQIASAAWLYEALSQFYFRAQRRWCASGKSIPRYLNADNHELAREFTQAFDMVFQTGESTSLTKLVQKILVPFGGLLWDGFQSNAPTTDRLEEMPSLLTKNNPFLTKIIPATLADLPLIKNLFLFYVYDIGRDCGLDEGWECPTNLSFVLDDLTPYFQDPVKSAFLVQVTCANGPADIAGFILLSQKGTPLNPQWKIDEFFIVNKYQGKGIAEQCAHQLWETHPGLWELSVLPQNKRALSFWRKIIAKFTAGKYNEVIKKIKTHKPQKERFIFNFDTKHRQT